MFNVPTYFSRNFKKLMTHVKVKCCNDYLLIYRGLYLQIIIFSMNTRVRN